MSIIFLGLLLLVACASAGGFASTSDMTADVTAGVISDDSNTITVIVPAQPMQLMPAIGATTHDQKRAIGHNAPAYGEPYSGDRPADDDPYHPKRKAHIKTSHMLITPPPVSHMVVYNYELKPAVCTHTVLTGLIFIHTPYPISIRDIYGVERATSDLVWLKVDSLTLCNTFHNQTILFTIGVQSNDGIVCSSVGLFIIASMIVLICSMGCCSRAAKRLRGENTPDANPEAPAQTGSTAAVSQAERNAKDNAYVIPINAEAVPLTAPEGPAGKHYTDPAGIAGAYV